MSNPTRNGKIARLPNSLREELNERLLNGECGLTLLAWLNALPVVQSVLAAEFGGRPINGPNLTAWRQQGYQQWLKEREARALAERLGRASLLKPEGEQGEMTERLVNWVTGRYAVAAARVRDAASAEEHWRLLHEMCADVSKLRCNELRQRGLELKKMRLERLP